MNCLYAVDRIYDRSVIAEGDGYHVEDGFVPAVRFSRKGQIARFDMKHRAHKRAFHGVIAVKRCQPQLDAARIERRAKGCVELRDARAALRNGLLVRDAIEPR